jgi:uncharacterized SAM-binding protein YcdF (DUF218 family)
LTIWESKAKNVIERWDAVIVLGAAVRAPGVAGPALRRRINHGIGVFFAREARFLVVSGGIVGSPPSEAHLMRDIALARGVPSDRIIIEDRSRNTFENAVYCGSFIRDCHWRRVVVVTDGFHIVRALYTFRRLGLSVDGDAVRRPPEISRRRWWCRYARDLPRLGLSAYLFARGVHKPIVEREWHL